MEGRKERVARVRVFVRTRRGARLELGACDVCASPAPPPAPPPALLTFSLPSQNVTLPVTLRLRSDSSRRAVAWGSERSTRAPAAAAATDRLVADADATRIARTHAHREERCIFGSVCSF